jgi:hypothetical protein
VAEGAVATADPGGKTGSEAAGSAAVAPLTPLTRSLATIGVVRLVLGVAGLFGALVVEDDDGVVGLTWFAGTCLLAIGALYRSRESMHWDGRLHAEPAPTDQHDPWWLMLARAAFPSTMTLTVLTAIALPINAVLAALLAGMIAGLGVAALTLAAEQAWWESRSGRRIEFEPGTHPRLFSRRR